MLTDPRRFRLKSNGKIEVVEEPVVEEKDNDGVIFDSGDLSGSEYLDDRFDSDYEENIH